MRSGRVDRVDSPCSRKALEVVLAPVGELEARAHDEIRDSARHEHVACAAERRDSRSDVDCHPRDVVAA